jgi:hypothetical protein
LPARPQPELSVCCPRQPKGATGSDAIRPFTLNFPQEDIDELRRRVAATRWPERETVIDATQGVQLATMQKLTKYWATDYDWSRCAAQLNALPHFLTEIEGLDIHFIHVRSKHENALPLIVTHGWPGSIIEQLKIIAPLTDPTSHGGNASDAFHLVIPSMPGYGFSGKTKHSGLGCSPHRARLACADETPRLREIRCTGWRLGRDYRRLDGSRRTSRIAWHPYEHGGFDSARH